MKDILNKIHHADNAKFTPQIPDGSLDIILEDPPYLYLKNQKLDRPFDELAHFTECYRMLREGGFIVIFGRGESFYRWNTILADLGFTFKEEIVWDKSYCSSPLMAISRVHETVSIWSKGNGKINKVKVPYLEMKGHDVPSICQDIKRMRSVFKNTKSLDAVLAFLENNMIDYEINRVDGLAASYHENSFKNSDRSAAVMSCITQGMNEKSIIRNNYRDTSDGCKANNLSISSEITKEDRSVSVMRSINQGMNEKSIIREGREHYKAIHPTQKPPRLLERLLALVIPQNKPREEIKVADFFGGSCNTAKACISMGVNYIITEIDKEYYDLGVENVEKFKEEFQPNLFTNII